MSKMIIYFCLFTPLLFLSADSSSIRGRNHKNDLVPFMNSRFDAMKRDPNSMKVVSKDPFIIQLQMPHTKEMEAKAVKEKDKKRKRPVKKRVSKIKPLRKKHRKRRDLLISRAKPREEKLFRFEIPRAVNNTERLPKNTTKNSVSRMEILKALSFYPKKTETKRNKPEGIRNVKDEEKISIGKTKKNNTLNRSLHKHHLSLSDRSKSAYPSTPKLDRRLQKYTYKDLMADRERLEKKISYIKNMLNTTTDDDGTRVRRRSDSDRTGNKIAKMFLTLSAVNGLYDKKKSKCNDYNEDDDDDRVDVWEKERRNNPLRKSTSSNEERYKVKKWIEFMKNKRSSGKTCPCMGNAYGDESDAFPLEQKVPKGYFLLERGRSSEESSEYYRDPFYYSRDKINRNENVKKRLSKSQEQDNKNKALSKNGNKKRLEVPFEDLEVYRSRARQILRNAEEILDKIKEEEEKRLAMPNILMSQLKELTARIHGDPRNNENDLIRKIQKNLGWGPLATPQEESDGTLLDNVKSLILDPYERAKALTDESTKQISSYLLRNLGKLQDSSEEQEMRKANDKNDDENLKVYLGEVPYKEKPSPASLAREEPRVDNLSKSKEDLQNWEDTLSAILGGGDDAVNKESNWDANREESSLQEVEGMVKETQKKLNDYKDEISKEISTVDVKESTKIPEIVTDIVAESKPESILEEEKVALNLKEKDDSKQDPTGFQLKDAKKIKSAEEPVEVLEKGARGSDIIKEQPFHETFEGKEGESVVQASRDMQEEEEKVAMTLNEKEDNKLSTTGFHTEDEKFIRSTEQPVEILEKAAKDLDNTNNQPFRGTEGTFKGEEEESVVQASRDMQEAEDEEKVETTLNEKEKEDTKIDTTGFQSKNEEVIKSAEEPAEILEKAAKDLDNTNNQPFRGTEGTFKGEEGESVVQASRDMQEEEDEEKVEMTLNEKEKDDIKIDTTGFQSKNEEVIKSAEEPAAILEEGGKGSEIIKKQPFPGVEGKERESNVQASRDMQEEEDEEKVEMTLNEKEDNKLDTTGSETKYETGIKSGEEPAAVLEKAAKDSDIKKQPFRGMEGTFEGKEGESIVQASRDMPEEKELKKEFEEVVEMLKDNDTESPETDEVIQNMKTEEKAASENLVAQVLEKPEDNEEVAIIASPELEKTTSREETLDDPANDERVEKKSDVPFPSITLIDKAPPTDSGLDTPIETEQKEVVKAQFENEYESNEEPILEKQMELDSDQSEEVEDEENKSVNFKEDIEIQEEKELPLLKESRKEDSLNEEMTQKEIGDKTQPGYADLVQEAKHVSEMNPNEEGDLEDEKRYEDILELDNEKTTSQEIVDPETLKAVLNNKEDTEKESEESVSREDSTEGLNTPLRATLQEASNQPVDETFSKESDDVLLKETNVEDEEKGTLESIKNESLEESEEILAKENREETLLPLEKSAEDSQSSEENDAFLEESNPDETFENLKGGEIPLQASMNNKDSVETQQYKSSEISDGDFDEDSKEMNLKASLDIDENLGNDEENLKSSLDKNEDLEKDDETILKASNRYGYDTQNLSEEKDDVSQKENQENDDQRGGIENVEKVLYTQDKLEENKKSSEDVGIEKENQENEYEERDPGTLVTPIRSLKKKLKESTASKENQNAENINENVETILRAEKFDENVNTEDEETNQETLKSMNNEKMENLENRESKEILKESNTNENAQDEKIEILEEIFKEISDRQKEESVQGDDDELESKKPRDEYLEAILKNETEENLEERPDENILKAEKDDEESQRSQEEINLEATLGQVEDAVLKEANIEDSEKTQDDLDDGEDVRAVFDNQEQYDEVMQNFDENKREKNDDVDDEKTLLKSENFEDELNNQNPHDETLKAVLSKQDQENFENPEEDRDETPLRNASLEDEFDNKIDYETALKSAQYLGETDEVESMKNANEYESEETLQGVPQDLSNQIDEENEEKVVLQSSHLDAKSPDGIGYSYETVTEGNVEQKSPLKESSREDTNSIENFQRVQMGNLQKPIGKSLQTSNLRVPKWIGRIMKDLNGKEKTDITSMQNLNPDKIDDMLGKIGKAEKQNLLESEEVDCRKECACAEEMSTRSRNMGRYEIVKDFLHWVKDLQLNRVLSDE